MIVTAVIQARMTSTRLPGKVLMPVLGEPLLLHQVRRLRRAKTLDRLVLAITDQPADDPLESFARRQGLAVFRGS
ncbi:MAG TPA: flagellin modification protein FlmC, partial [Alphaproteobacteria bacterium]|nr:flagellin modification protein FlmC [Alphaproteobacteria bacterium]